MGTRRGRGPSVVPAAPVQAESVAQPEVLIDRSLLTVSRELSGLAQVQVSQAAKERGWSSLQRELERRPVRAAGKAAGAPAAAAKGAARHAGAARPGHSRSWRWALGSAAAAVAVVATLLGAYGGGLLQTVDNGPQPSTITSVVSSDTTEPVTTVSTDGTTVSADGSGTTSVQPSTTVSTSTTVAGPSTTQGAGPSTTGPAASTTTLPSSPSTTGGQQNTATEREGSAKAASTYLADLVITGNTSGARNLVAAEAQSSLAQMMDSLSEPYGYRVISVLSLTGDTVRVTLEISDRVTNGRGELVETTKRFFIKVRVDSKGAVVTAINAGS